jgi:site-specific recombinase XerD
MAWTKEKAAEKLKADAGINEKDKTLILNYTREREAINNLSDRRVQKIFNLMRNITKMKRKPWNRFRGRQDVIGLVGKINLAGFTGETIADHKKEFKRFYKWLVKNPHPPEIEDIKITIQNANRKLPELMLTEEDIIKMVKAERTIKHKAIIMTLWSSGARAAELLGMKVGSIQFDDNGAKIRLSGKTGDRYVRVIEAVPYLKEYLEKYHPRKDDINAPLWIHQDNTQMEYQALRSLLRRISEKCRIQKPSHPHHFRASRATYLAKFLTSSQLKAFFGWKETAMCDVYISMHGKDVDDAVQRIYGSKPQEPERSKLTPQVCPRCQQQNGPDEPYCSICDYPLREDVAVAYDEKMKIWLDIYKELLKEPEVQKILEKMLRKKKPMLVKVTREV